MPRVLITGATGFIGSRLARSFAGAATQVVALGLTNTEAERQRWEMLSGVDRIDLREVSVTEPDALRDAMAGVDAVFHLAAAQHEAGMPYAHFQQVNVEGTRHVFEAALAAGVRRVVHASTIGVYQPQALVTLATPLGSSNHYGQTKLEAERMIEAEYRDRIQTVVIRISETYGPHDNRLLKMYRAIAAGRWFHVGKGENPHHPIYIDDLVDCLAAAAEAEAAVGQTLIAAGPETVTSREMADYIAVAVGVRRPTFTVPLAPMKIVAVVLETLSRPMHVTPPLHRRRLDFFVRAFQFDTSFAEEVLGFHPRVNFARGALLTAAWYQDQGMLDLGDAPATPAAPAERSDASAEVRRSA
jgi:nucleoside-diphosphate-sugar epimerase